ncbi:hypothetical protein SAMN02910298_01700 [Pseudobutyrivibrio sp. YE44]|uniref:hypothetical protein n=1 Tax=Pseudobutyrivibrio sp. YE44 TaxID=1520802 RepID=UPI000882081E|nr:hypothetical protein [Pseudobutyrivibrio sp. YE44]SDB34795.1 hypothetical protein SAMN02910298_01700 [Pseudobutyrivibrio sp. YE44]
MNYKKALLVASAFTLVGLASIKPAMAYFTDYAMVVGYKTVHIEDPQLTPPEDTVDIEKMIKTVAITNTGDFDVYVRVKAICPTGIKAEMTADTKGWKLENDGYYYYDSLLKNKNSEEGKTSSNLNFKITTPENYTKDFNVIILQEATKVHYDKSGQPYAEWNEAIQSKEEVYSKDVKSSEDNAETQLNQETTEQEDNANE